MRSRACPASFRWLPGIPGLSGGRLRHHRETLSACRLVLERLFDPSVPQSLVPVDAPGVYAQQDRDAVLGAAGDLGARTPAFRLGVTPLCRRSYGRPASGESAWAGVSALVRAHGPGGSHDHQARPRATDHSQRPVPSMRRRRPGAQPGMHLRQQRAHLHAHDLYHLWRHRTQQAVTGSTKRCILEVWAMRRRQRQAHGDVPRSWLLLLGWPASARAATLNHLQQRPPRGAPIGRSATRRRSAKFAII